MRLTSKPERTTKRRNTRWKSMLTKETMQYDETLMLEIQFSSRKKARKISCQPPLNENHYVITSKKDSMVTAKSSKESITRNASFFKILPNTKLQGREEKATSEEAIKEPKTKSCNPKPSTRNAVVAEQPRRSERIRRPHAYPPPYLEDYVLRKWRNDERYERCRT